MIITSDVRYNVARLALGLTMAATRLLAQSVPAPSHSENSVRLDDVLASALATHPLLDAARARVVAAHGARRTAGALPNPVLTFWAENAAFPGQRPTTPLDLETQAYATLPLESVYQRWPRMRAADADIGAATADVARVRQAVVLDAARAFYRVAAAQVAVDGADVVRASLEELVTYTQARVREGKTAEADLIRTQIELDRIDAVRALDEVELSRARATLLSYVNGPAVRRVEADTVLRVIVDEPSRTANATMPTLAAMLDAARAARPDLIAARARADAASATASFERALTVRQVGVTLGSKRTLGVSSLIASVSVPLPLFDQNRGEIQRTIALRNAADADLAWTERQAAAEVAAAYATATSLTRQAARLNGFMLSRAEESRGLAFAAYREGAVSLLQVLDATRTLAETRLAYFRLLFAHRESLLELRAAVGDSALIGPPTSSSLLPTSAPFARPSGNRP